MSNMDNIIEQVDKLITHLEQVTHQNARPVQKVPKQQKEEQKAVDISKYPEIVQEFCHCDLHVTQVVECSRCDFSDKLLRMKLKVSNENGGEFREFAAGIAQFYKPEEMINRRIVTILNLPPRPMAQKKIVSNAMLFCGSNEDHSQVVLCTPLQDESIPIGSRVYVEGYEQQPEAKTNPKKHFEKVLDKLQAKDKCMALDGMFLMANGHKISVDVPDGWHLG